ncbi:MAG: hypothetical protein ACLQVD_15040 [Capsulimonadaceae bacterium]
MNGPNNLPQTVKKPSGETGAIILAMVLCSVIGGCSAYQANHPRPAAVFVLGAILGFGGAVASGFALRNDISLRKRLAEPEVPWESRRGSRRFEEWDVDETADCITLTRTVASRLRSVPFLVFMGGPVVAFEIVSIYEIVTAPLRAGDRTLFLFLTIVVALLLGFILPFLLARLLPEVIRFRTSGIERNGTRMGEIDDARAVVLVHSLADSDTPERHNLVIRVGNRGVTLATVFSGDPRTIRPFGVHLANFLGCEFVLQEPL